MRLFLAINPPAAFQRDVWNATQATREAGPSIRWVAETRLHITLKFLGEQPQAAVPPLADALRVVGAGLAAPVVRVGGIGAFPNFRRPHVIWIGIDPEPRLELLHHDVEVACGKLGYEIDGRPFRPHLTLGRVSGAVDREQLRAVRAAAKQVRFTDDFQALAIDMMQSTTDPSGSIYATLATAPMRGV